MIREWNIRRQSNNDRDPTRPLFQPGEHLYLDILHCALRINTNKLNPSIKALLQFPALPVLTKEIQNICLCGMSAQYYHSTMARTYDDLGG